MKRGIMSHSRAMILIEYETVIDFAEKEKRCVTLRVAGLEVSFAQFSLVNGNRD